MADLTVAAETCVALGAMPAVALGTLGEFESLPRSQSRSTHVSLDWQSR